MCVYLRDPGKRESGQSEDRLMRDTSNTPLRILTRDIYRICHWDTRLGADLRRRSPDVVESRMQQQSPWLDS